MALDEINENHNEQYSSSNLDDPPELVEETSNLSARQKFDTNLHLRGNSDPGYWSAFIDSSDLAAFKKQAYVNPDGIAIRINPETGYKELFIAGSRSNRDWFQNFVEVTETGLKKGEILLQAKGGYNKAKLAQEGQYLESASPFGQIALEELENILQTSTVARDQFSSYIDTIIEEEGVEVVYGHSRGAAIMSGLHSDVKKVGLDGAMVIGHEDSDFINVIDPGYTGFSFDTLLTTGYKHNVELPGRRFHDVTRDRTSLGKRARAIWDAYRGHKPKEPEPTEKSLQRVRKRKKLDTRGFKSRKRVQILDKVLGRKRPAEKKAEFEANLKKLKKAHLIKQEDYDRIKGELAESKGKSQSKKRTFSEASKPSTDTTHSSRKPSKPLKTNSKKRKRGHYKDDP